MKRLTLSNSRLSLYTECPRCFWLDLNAGIKRPDTIFPSLPGGLDAQFKRYFDQFRASGDVPPEVKGKLPGRLLSDVGTINRWRDWRRGIRYTPRWADCELMGALDECLVDEAGFYYPLDYKTRGYAPKTDTHEYYQDQMNLYTLLLELHDADGGLIQASASRIGFRTVEIKDGLVKIKAFVVPAHGMKADTKALADMQDELERFGRKRLAPHKIPRTVKFMDELPKTGQGKIDRRLLREQAL